MVSIIIISSTEDCYTGPCSYCVNAMFFVLMKGSQESTRSHPVFSRLLSLKQLLAQLDTLHPPSLPTLSKTTLSKTTPSKVTH